MTYHVRIDATRYTSSERQALSKQVADWLGINILEDCTEEHVNGLLAPRGITWKPTIEYGCIFTFEDRAEAILFKLTFGGNLST